MPPGGGGNLSANDQKESMLVFGEAIPNGECWYVLRKNKHDDREIELWNPNTGIKSQFGRIKEVQ